DGVGADGVDAQLLEEGDIALAELLVGQRVDVVSSLVVRLALGRGVLLVGNALHEELGPVLVEELLTLDVDGRQLGGSQARQSEHGKLGETHCECRSSSSVRRKK